MQNFNKNVGGAMAKLVVEFSICFSKSSRTYFLERFSQEVYFIIVLRADYLESTQIGFSGLLEDSKL